MPRVFCLSYARERAGVAPVAGSSELDQFFTDLQRQVGGLLRDDGVPAGFRDLCHIEAGSADWQRDLGQALQTHPIGLALLSPSYLDPARPWCKWEFDFLLARNLAYYGLPDAVVDKKPRLLLVLNWTPPQPADMPTDYLRTLQGAGPSMAQRDDGSSDPLDRAAVERVLRAGIKNTVILQRAGDDQATGDYSRFLLVLADYVLRQYKRFEAVHARGLDPRAQLPAFENTQAWQLPHRSIAAQAPMARPDKRRKAHVLYLAARPEELSAESADESWRYQDDGEGDWKPFAGAHPSHDDVHAGALIGQVKGFDLEPWPFAYVQKQMNVAMAKAGTGGKGPYPVLLVVDPWTATHVPPYRQVLRSFATAERAHHVYATPVVVWNDQDPRTARCAADFVQQVEPIFGFTRWQRVRQGDQEFEQTIQGNLQLLQQNIRNVRADHIAPKPGDSLPHVNPNR